MCGIVGYIGKENSISVGMDALKRLEYRGYDSAGFAVFDKDKNQINSFKAVGKISSLENKIKKMEIKGMPSIFHTRWATHGEVTEENAHPHFDCKENIFLAHNGIIENYKELKEKLVSEGHKFVSETDTEVLAHLIEKFFGGNLEEAVQKALKLVKGSYGIVVIARDDPEKIVAARLSSPLLVGVNGNDYIVASDATAICSYTRKVINLEDNEIVTITPEKIFITRNPEDLEIEEYEAEKGGFSHFTLKEIFEQPEAIRNSIKGRLIPEEGLVNLGGFDRISGKLKEADKIIIVGCGTARHAALVGEYMIEEYAGIPVEVDAGSEFRYRKPVINKNTVVIAISQSGETADTLAAVREAKRKGALVVGLTNVVSSSQAREVDAGIYNHVGPEIGVAATKSFVSQLAVLALLTVYFGRQRDMSLVTGKRIIDEIQKIPEHIEKILQKSEYVKEIAQKYSSYRNFFFLGRKYNYPIASEGALKLKEIAHSIHSEGCPAGELKHGFIALIDKDFPSLCISPSDSVYEKMQSNIEEIKARSGKVIALATEGNKDIEKIADDTIYMPKTLEMLTPILSVVPLQLLAAYIGIELGLDIDKPRNLAKSVTVE